MRGIIRNHAPRGRENYKGNSKGKRKKGKEKGKEEALVKVILQLNQKGFGSKEIADMLDKEEEEIEAVLLGKEPVLA